MAQRVSCFTFIIAALSLPDTKKNRALLSREAAPNLVGFGRPRTTMSLLSLPNELLFQISELLDTPEQFAIRFVCRSLKRASSDAFCARHFKSLRIDYHQAGLQRLVNITSQPHLLKKLEMISFEVAMLGRVMRSAKWLPIVRYPDASTAPLDRAKSSMECGRTTPLCSRKILGHWTGLTASEANIQNSWSCGSISNYSHQASTLEPVLGIQGLGTQVCKRCCVYRTVHLEC